MDVPGRVIVPWLLSSQNSSGRTLMNRLPIRSRTQHTTEDKKRTMWQESAQSARTPFIRILHEIFSTSTVRCETARTALAARDDPMIITWHSSLLSMSNDIWRTRTRTPTLVDKKDEGVIAREMVLKPPTIFDYLRQVDRTKSLLERSGWPTIISGRLTCTTYGRYILPHQKTVTRKP